MARPRAFDKDEVLDAAIDCFWADGFQATSVRDLAAEMRLNTPSVYNAFGDKHALFVLALERYAERSMRERIRRLESTRAPRAAIKAYFAELIERSLADASHRGCLIVNAALEVAPRDPVLRPVILQYLGEIEDFFRRCLHAAAEQGELPARLKPKAGARMLLGLLMGLRVAARTGPTRAFLEDMVRPALAMLDRRDARAPRRKA